MIPRSILRNRAFTIIELLTAMVILSIIMLAVVTVIGESSAIWRRASNKIESFQASRAAFETLTRNLSQATLNTYYDYDDPNSPTFYVRRSELAFVLGPAGKAGLPGTSGTGQAVFFQAPASVYDETSSTKSPYRELPDLLNTCGYFVQFDRDVITPDHVKSSSDSYRYRLMQLVVPTEQNTIYDIVNPKSPVPTDFSWFDSFVGDALPIADNVVALFLLPKDPEIASDDPAAGAITGDYTYNSREGFPASKGTPQAIFSHQLPPIILVTMIAISEQSANLIESGSSEPNEIAGALAGKFLNSANYSSDLESVREALNSATPPIDYRIFTSAIPMRESKWTKD